MRLSPRQFARWRRPCSARLGGRPAGAPIIPMEGRPERSGGGAVRLAGVREEWIVDFLRAERSARFPAVESGARGRESFPRRYRRVAPLGSRPAPKLRHGSQGCQLTAGIAAAIPACASRFRVRCRAREAGNRTLQHLQPAKKLLLVVPTRLRVTGREPPRFADDTFPKSPDSRSPTNSVRLR